eukprot:COSAG01_NODE_46310_length_401_cov_0.831126_1_plen_107_part_10
MVVCSVPDRLLVCGGLTRGRSTRDLWLSSRGGQSLGRSVMGQQVVSLDALSLAARDPAAAAGVMSAVERPDYGGGGEGQRSDAVADAEVWATITLNSAFAATMRVVV